MVNQLAIAGILGGYLRHCILPSVPGSILMKLQRQFRAAPRNRQMNNRASTMAKREYDFGFAIDWMRKDLGFALDVAERLGVHLPIATMVDAQYANVQENGGGRWDTSGLIEQIRIRGESRGVEKTRPCDPPLEDAIAVASNGPSKPPLCWIRTPVTAASVISIIISTY